MSREVPSGWRNVNLGDVALNVTEKWEPGEHVEPYVGLEQMEQGAGRLLEVGVSEAIQSIKTRFRSGDVLFGKLRPNLRKSALVDFSGIASTDILVIRPTECMTRDFAFYQLSSNEAFDHAIKSAAGTKMPRTSWKDMADFEFPLPPHHEQRRIAEILSSVDEAIAATRAVIEQTRKVKQGVLERLLTKGIGHTRFKQTEIGEIPEGWEVVQISDVAALIDSGWSPDCDKVAASEGEWGILKTSAVVWDGYQPHENKKLPHSLVPRPEIEVKAGDVLITRAGPVDRTGVVALVKNTQRKLMLSDKIIRIQTIADQCMPGFLSLWLSSPLAQNEIIKKKSGMAQSQTNISQKALRELLVSLPPLDEQIQIADAVQSVDDGIGAECAKLDALVEAKSSLMSDLLTGRKRVTDALPMAAE